MQTDFFGAATKVLTVAELTRAIRLVAKADLALRSNPVSKRLVLEQLVMALAAEPKPEQNCPWLQDQLPQLL